MIFDFDNVQIRLHETRGPSGLLVWEAALSTTRTAKEDYICRPERSEGGLGHTLASWLADAGPQVALQWTMGGIWQPNEVGIQLSIAVMGSTPDQARQRVQARARQLAMWLKVHHAGADWSPVDAIRNQEWHLLPLRLQRESPHFLQECGLCDRREEATERFLDVSHQTGSGLLWTLRSRPIGVKLERLLGQLSDRRSETRRTRFDRARHEDPACVRQILRMPEAQPFALAAAIVSRTPVDDLVRFAAQEAVMELGTRECETGTADVLPTTLGVHGAFRFIDGDRLHGLDRVTAKQLLRWIPCVEDDQDDEEENPSISRPSGPSVQKDLFSY